MEQLQFALGSIFFNTELQQWWYVRNRSLGGGFNHLIRLIRRPPEKAKFERQGFSLTVLERKYKEIDFSGQGENLCSMCRKGQRRGRICLKDSDLNHNA